MIWIILFYCCVYALAHSYVLYPLFLKWRTRGMQSPQYPAFVEWPTVSVLMAVYNEEQVVEQKIKSVFNTNYPSAKLEMLIGSDGSTDKTDAIIEQLIQQGYNIKFERFGGRNGKTQIMNALVPKASGSIFIPTDANIIFDVDTIPNLLSPFTKTDIGLVAANIINTGLKEDGISFQEQSYIQRENSIKYREGLLWGTLMGAFGACYAIRKELFPTIPRNFFMEDFFITLSVIKAPKKAIVSPTANAFEDVSNAINEEFKRKIRISAGNFQNLAVFWPLLLKPFTGAGFSFLSHKVLRWLGPFFLIGAFLANLFLFRVSDLYKITLGLQLLGILTPLLDNLFSRMKVHIFGLRLLAYFYSMNMALLLGFFKYAKGIKSSTWNPTQRNI